MKNSAAISRMVDVIRTADHLGYRMSQKQGLELDSGVARQLDRMADSLNGTVTRLSARKLIRNADVADYRRTIVNLRATVAAMEGRLDGGYRAEHGLDTHVTPGHVLDRHVLQSAMLHAAGNARLAITKLDSRIRMTDLASVHVNTFRDLSKKLSAPQSSSP
jgi:hypothetical protein